MRKTVFLFGAGASVGAGCPVVRTIDNELIKIIETDEFLSSRCNWIKDLWELTKQYARETVLTMGRFEPNFENLVFLVEHLEGYTEIFKLQTRESIKLVKKLAVDLEFRNQVDAYAALYAGLLKISTYSQGINPLDRQIKLKGSSAKYMWAGRALRKLISNKIPTAYNLEYLNPFAQILKNPAFDFVLATLNYDLVLDQFLKDNEISFDDGFTNSSKLDYWKGFSGDDCLKYLKLHGSLNWFQIKENWFAEKPSNLSVNEVYKYANRDICPLLRSEFKDKWKKDPKYKYEFNIPHLIMGGNKDGKILEMPFIEIFREWSRWISVAENIVIVGVSASDSHILKQLEGLLISNSNLQKIIIINPAKNNNNALGQFVRSSIENRERRNLFYLDCKWDLAKVENSHKIPLEQMLLMSGTELVEFFKNELNA